MTIPEGRNRAGHLLTQQHKHNKTFFVLHILFIFIYDKNYFFFIVVIYIEA
jgi:hypothetical protein